MREVLFRGKRIDNNQWIEGTAYGEMFSEIVGTVFDNVDLLEG